MEDGAALPAWKADVLQQLAGRNRRIEALCQLIGTREKTDPPHLSSRMLWPPGLARAGSKQQQQGCSGSGSGSGISFFCFFCCGVGWHPREYGLQGGSVIGCVVVCARVCVYVYVVLVCLCACVLVCNCLRVCLPNYPRCPHLANTVAPAVLFIHPRWSRMRFGTFRRVHGRLV